MYNNIKSSKSRQNAFQSYRLMVIPSLTASRILTRYLGKTEAEWLDFLRKDRDICAAGGRIACYRRGDDFMYSEIGIFAYIAQCDRLALDRGIPDTPREVNRFGFSVKVKLDIDYEDGVRPFVHLDCINHQDKPNGLTPTEARSLAKELTKAAARCERDTPSKLLARLGGFDFRGQVAPAAPVFNSVDVAVAKAAYEKAMADAAKPAAWVPYAIAHSTGDPELDALLSDMR